MPALAAPHRQHPAAPHQTPWREDQTILQRLEKVEPLRVMGISARQIGQQVGVSHVTVLDDFKRIDELWLERHASSLDAKRAAHLAALDETLHQTWLAFLAAQSSSLNRSGYINAIRGLLADRAKLLGINAPEKRELTGKDGGPLQIEAAELRERLQAELEQAAERAGLLIEGP